MELQKLQIIGYVNSSYTTTDLSRQFAAQINPAQVKVGKQITYKPDNTLGKEKKAARYRHHDAANLSFDLFLDDTGVIPGKKKNIKALIDELENALYKTNAESHEPGYAKIVWGSLIFHGRIKSLSYDYTLFLPNGVPLRVKVSVAFIGHFDKDVTVKNSPDVSRTITFKAGDKLAAFCREIYNDASYCVELARLNNLQTFRNIPPGTKIMFPPLINFSQNEQLSGTA
ncbi:hypothetical protein [Pedobacter sp. ASV28]|uniref:CIS tube protein n=1 Tax=Pedobacter sp. ASV28 TaxID=2795123 RepID=UPI0018EAB5D3|nr:hypothetical protein [Pedobacter sp. ASV28]